MLYCGGLAVKTAHIFMLNRSQETVSYVRTYVCKYYGCTTHHYYYRNS